MLIRAKKSVIIAGAGPVGLLIAIRLGKEGISTLVLEQGDSLPRTTRALVNNPVVLGLLSKCGVLEPVMKEAYLVNDGAVWMDIEGNKLAHLTVASENPDEFAGVMLVGQARMNDIFLEEVSKYPSVEVLFGAKVTAVENLPSADKVRVLTWQRSNGEQDVCYEADWVVGADGTGSTVRRSLFVPFEGYTFPDWKMLSTHVAYNFASENHWGPINCIVDQLEWAVILNTGEDAQGRGCKPEDAVWRVSFGEDPSLPNSKEALMERAIKRVARYTKPDAPFKVLSTEPYYLHQRCAAQARIGRVVFAGDALHANNPCGGLGLTTGIVDAFCYGNALARVISDGEPDSLLTECATSRRDAWLNVTNPTSIMNFKRDSGCQDEDAVKFRTMFFHKLNNDPNFSKLLGQKLAMLLTRGFERGEEVAPVHHDGVSEQKGAGERNGVGAPNGVGEQKVEDVQNGVHPPNGVGKEDAAVEQNGVDPQNGVENQDQGSEQNEKTGQYKVGEQMEVGKQRELEEQNVVGEKIVLPEPEKVIVHDGVAEKNGTVEKHEVL